MVKVKDMKRVTFRVSPETLGKMENIAQRYGISINSLCSYVIGRWVEENSNLQEKILDRLSGMMIEETVIDKMLSHPMYGKIIEESVRVGLETGLKAVIKKSGRGGTEGAERSEP